MPPTLPHGQPLDLSALPDALQAVGDLTNVIREAVQAQERLTQALGAIPVPGSIPGGRPGLPPNTGPGSGGGGGSAGAGGSPLPTGPLAQSMRAAKWGFDQVTAEAEVVRSEMVSLVDAIAHAQRSLRGMVPGAVTNIPGAIPVAGRFGHPWGGYPPGGYFGQPFDYPPGQVPGQPTQKPPAPPKDPGQKAFDKAQKGLYGHAGTLSNLGMGRAAGVATRLGGVASGLNDIGLTGAGTALSRVAAPVATIGSVIGTTGKLVEASYDRYSTNAQSWRRLARDVIPGAGPVLDTYDAYSGRRFEMEQADIAARFRGVDVQARLGVSAYNLGFNPQQAGREASAAAYRLPGAMVVPPVIDRSTSAGEQQYRDAMRLLPLKQQSVRMDREARAATAERLAAEREMARLEAERLRLLQQKSALNNRLVENDRDFFGGSGAKRQEILQQQGTVNQNLLGIADQQRSAREAVSGARAREAAARAEAERAKVQEEHLGRAQNLQERATRAKSVATRIGMMNPLEAQQSAAILQYLQKNPGAWATLPPEWKSMAMSLAPEVAQKYAERAGGAHPAFGQLQQTRAADDIGRPGQSPADIQREVDTEMKALGEKEFHIDSQSAEAIAAAFKSLGKDIAQIIEQKSRLTADEIRRELHLGRNQ